LENLLIIQVRVDAFIIMVFAWVVQGATVVRKDVFLLFSPFKKKKRYCEVVKIKSEMTKSTPCEGRKTDAII